jgi:hypothetical protein
VLIKVLPLLRQPYRKLGFRRFKSCELVVSFADIAVHAGRYQIPVIFRSSRCSRVKVVNRQVAPRLKRVASVPTIDAAEFVPLENAKVSPNFSGCCHVFFSLFGLLAFFVSANIAFLVANFFAVPVREPRDSDNDAEKDKHYQPVKNGKFAHAHLSGSNLALKPVAAGVKH